MSQPALLQALPPRESAVAACARSLRESILRGELPAGSSLPPERELAVTLGVNRLTLRAALAQLGAAGLISVRHGSGNLVRDYAEAGGPDLLKTLIGLARDHAQWRQVVRDMLLVRRALARAVLERLTLECDSKRLLRLEKAVEVFAAEVERPGSTADSIAQADQTLVRALLKETGTVLALAANPIFRVLEEFPELRAAMFAEPALNLAGYRMLLDGLRRKNKAMGEAVLETLASMDEAVLERLSNRRKTR